MRNLICVLIVAFVSVSALAQDYYIWVDEYGVTNYAQKKPQGVDSRLVSASKGGSQAIVDTQRGSRPGARAYDAAIQTETDEQAEPTGEDANEEIDPDDIIAEDRAAVAAKIAEQKRSNCDIGKKQLTTLEMFRRIRVKDENGEDRVLSAVEKATRTATARQIIRENCTK